MTFVDRVGLPFRLRRNLLFAANADACSVAVDREPVIAKLTLSPTSVLKCRGDTTMIATVFYGDRFACLCSILQDGLVHDGQVPKTVKELTRPGGDVPSILHIHWLLLFIIRCRIKGRWIILVRRSGFSFETWTTDPSDESTKDRPRLISENYVTSDFFCPLLEDVIELRTEITFIPISERLGRLRVFFVLVAV